MPWYYAGPEAKPVGPVTLEELKALRARGTVAPETYVIEEKGQGMSGLAWKRYQELFPDAASLPPLPPLPGLPPLTQAPYVPPPVPPVTPPPVLQGHPLFPSAAPAAYPSSVSPVYHPSSHQPPPFNPAARPDVYRYGKPTNGWCAWGFGIGLASFCFSLFLCGSGFLPALLAVPICIVGLLKLNKHREQAGLWLAIWGLVLSGLALVVAGIYFYYLAMPIMKSHGLTVTEETTNDSE
jgi:hypothetical protein